MHGGVAAPQRMARLGEVRTKRRKGQPAELTWPNTKMPLTWNHCRRLPYIASVISVSYGERTGPKDHRKWALQLAYITRAQSEPRPKVSCSWRSAGSCFFWLHLQFMSRHLISVVLHLIKVCLHCVIMEDMEHRKRLAPMILVCLTSTIDMVRQSPEL